MTTTVKAELNKANPNNIADLMQLAKFGDMPAPRAEKVAVSSHIGTLSRPAQGLIDVYATVGTSAGAKLPIAKGGAPSAGECAIDEDGNVIFNATDAVTEATVVYIPVEGELYEETILVNGSGEADLSQSRMAAQIVSATLNNSGGVASPGAKTVIARGGTPSAGEACLNDSGVRVNFNGTDSGTGGTATVSYYLFPGEGDGVDESLQARLEATYG